MKQGPDVAADPSAVLGAYSQFVSKTDRWDDVSRVLAQRDITAEQFFSVIPRHVAEFALLLRTPITFQALALSAPPEVSTALKAAKEAADEHFQGIEQHPAVLKTLQNRLKLAAARREDIGLSSAPLTEFTEFHATPMWMEGDERLAPAVAISLTSGDRILLKAIVDWDDLSFLTWVTTNLLRNEFRRATKMAKKQNIDMLYGELLADRIAEMTAALTEINQLASTLNIRQKSSKQE